MFQMPHQGPPLALQAAVRSCSAGGKVVLVGMGDELMKLDMTHACTHEIDIVGSFRYANTVCFLT